MQAIESVAQQHPDNRTLIRDVAVLQVKLIVDGFRDLVLVPASLIAGFVSLLRREDGVPGRQFYRLLAHGKRSEQWINLFGAVAHSPDCMDRTQAFDDIDMDDIVSSVETFVVDEYRRGGLTAQAKARFEQVMAAMQRRSEK